MASKKSAVRSRLAPPQKLTANLLAVLASCCVSIASAAPFGDIVFFNGAVYTVDTARSWASALVVTGDHISYVGDDAKAKAFIGPNTRAIDLQRRMLLPGFQDSHVHPTTVANPATALDLFGLTTRDQIFDRIRQYAKYHPEKKWIVGQGWDEGAFLPSGQPTKEMLDALVPVRPVYIPNKPGHASWVNSAALKAAHITDQTPDPPNARLERDSQGHLTGVLHETNAQELVRSVIPPLSVDDRVVDLKASLDLMSRLGVTSLMDAMVTPEIAETYQAMDKRGILHIRSTLCLRYSSDEDDNVQFKRFVDERSAIIGHRIRAPCVKIYTDGSYGSHTIALLQPYSDDPQKFGTGMLFVDPERLKRVVTHLDAADFQVHLHATGDRAVRTALDALADARRQNGIRGNRDTIAHLALIDPTDIPRFRTLGVIANMSPFWSMNDPWEAVFAPRLFGPERTSHNYPMRSLLDTGAIVVWGSDWPVSSVSPLDGIETATTHRYPGGKDPGGKEDQVFNPGQRLSLEQAIVAYTSAGAYLLQDEAVRGTLEVGKFADLVVLDRNLFEISPFDIHHAKVDMTIVDGQVVYTRIASEANQMGK